MICSWISFDRVSQPFPCKAQQKSLWTLSTNATSLKDREEGPPCGSSIGRIHSKLVFCSRGPRWNLQWKGWRSGVERIPNLLSVGCCNYYANMFAIICLSISNDFNGSHLVPDIQDLMWFRFTERLWFLAASGRQLWAFSRERLWRRRLTQNVVENYMDTTLIYFEIMQVVFNPQNRTWDIQGLPGNFHGKFRPPTSPLRPFSAGVYIAAAQLRRPTEGWFHEDISGAAQVASLLNLLCRYRLYDGQRAPWK